MLVLLLNDHENEEVHVICFCSDSNVILCNL